MEYEINRYDLNKNFISSGVLKVKSHNQETQLQFTDSIINVVATGLYHPIKALESLREILESNYQSIIACNGCRIDTSYRASGGYGTYLINNGEPATEVLNLFTPTSEITKLCTVKEHKIAHSNWLKSIASN